MAYFTKWNKLTASFAAASTIALSATGALAETNLTVWGWSQDFNGVAMETAMERYQKDHPDVTIEFNDIGWAPTQEKLQAQLASGSSEGLPDIVLLEDYSIQRFLISFPDAFVATSDVMDLSGLAPYKLAVAQSGDKTYSVPFDAAVAGFFYHRADLEAAGFKPEDLKDITWDRFIEIGQAVKEATGKNLIAHSYAGADLMRVMMQSVGMWYTNSDGEITAETDPRFKQVLEEFIKVMQSGIVEDVNGWTDYVNSFTGDEGKVTGVISGLWMSQVIQENKDQAGEWAVAPVPRVASIEGGVNASNLGGSSWYVLSEGKNRDVALDFLNEIWVNDPGFYDVLLDEIGAFGSLLELQNSETYNRPSEFYGGQAVNADFASWLGDVPSVDFGMFTSEAEAAFTAVMPDVIRGEESIDDAMADYTQRLSQQIQ